MTIRKSMRDFRNDHCDNIYWTAFSAQKLAELMCDSRCDNSEVSEFASDTDVMGAYFSWAFGFIQDETAKLAENNDCASDASMKEATEAHS